MFISAATFLICFSPMLILLLSAGPRARHPIGEEELFSADLVNFVVPSPNNSLFGGLVRAVAGRAFANVEHEVYFGLTALALGAVGFWAARGKERRWAGRAFIAGILFIVIALGPTIHFLGRPTTIPSLAAPLYKLSFAHFLREPARLSVMSSLCVAMLATIGLAFLSDQLKSRWQRNLLACAIGIALIAEYATLPFPNSSVTDPRLYTDAPTTTRACTVPASANGGTVLTVPLAHFASWKNAMWMQLMDGGRYNLVEGYAGIYVPQNLVLQLEELPIIRSLRHLPEQPADASRDGQYARALCKKLDLRAVVVFDAPKRPTEMDYVRQVFGGKETWVGTCAVFELMPGSD